MQVHSTQRTGNASLLIFPPNKRIQQIAEPLKKAVKKIDHNAILMHPTNPYALSAVKAHMGKLFQEKMSSYDWLNGFRGLDANADAWNPEWVTKLYMSGLTTPQLRPIYLQALPERAQKLLQGLWNRHTNSVILLSESNAKRFRNPYSAILKALETDLNQLTTRAGEWLQVGNVEHFAPNSQIAKNARNHQIAQALKNPVAIGNTTQGKKLLDELKQEAKAFNQEA